MVKAKAKAKAIQYVVVGQSQCTAPAGGSTTFAYKAFNPIGIDYKIRAITGVAWTDTGYDLTDAAPATVDPLATQATASHIIMCGCQTDIWNGDTAASIYADMVAYAQARIAAGFASVIALTVPPNTTNTGPQETVRLALNDLIVNDAAGAFDVKVDLRTNADIENAAIMAGDPDTDFYYDGVHWTEAATAIVAALLLAALGL